VTGTILLHLLPLSAYRDRPSAPIGSPTLDTQGFVHCSRDVHTTLAVANTLYRDADEPMVALELDAAKLSAPLRWEPADPAPPEGTPEDALFPHVYGALDRCAVTAVRYARRDISGRYLDLEKRGETAEEFDLLPHPKGGWYRRTWASPVEVRGHSGSRPTATAIYFLLPPGETSAWHTVASDKLWLWHRGGPVTLALGGDAARPAESSRSMVLGPDAPQALVPAGTWQRATASPAAETLVSCVVSPGFDFADFGTL
jgi:uncharacterized protein